MNSAHSESAFEAAIERSLLASGWHWGRQDGYLPELGLDMAEVFAFLGATQPREWDRVRDFYPDGADEAQRAFGKRLAQEIDSRGTLDVLRHGIKDRGVLLKLAYFRPAHTVTDDALVEYHANRLTVTRQLHHSDKHPHDSLDLVLFLNGLPVATAELKNHLTGQTVEHAKQQYRQDRDPTDVLLSRRAVVHFAVDPELVFLTTKLEGAKTQFLPFNTGSEGPGVSGAGGNPPALSDGYRTSYLWQQVWQRDNWLDLLRRFVHEEKPKNSARKAKGKKPQRTTIFPRYHQWDSVLRLTDHVSRHGSGSNYLVMHSAGSGKSNTIAWLAHRLSSLHTPGDVAELDADAASAGLQPNQQVFDKIIVITDRTILDKQLQDTIYQFEHVPGVVERITGTRGGSKSAHAAWALSEPSVKILIATLQTFPFVLDQVTGIGEQRFALIVDEAHSSQSGESARGLKRVLLKLGSEDMDEEGDPLTASAFARGQHPNMSYFAFTATPKPKTLTLFGTPNAIGNYEPFHVYSMRQAIDEGFILDVLRNYVTYKTYFRLATDPANENKEVEARKAKAAIVRFAELHPTSMQQRAEIIVEHFHQHTASRLGGRAKAMVVTRSREHAVRLYWAIREYVQTRGYRCGVLAAISETFTIDGQDITEYSLNGFNESELPDRFAYTRADDPHAKHSDKQEFRILVVADKYQTGFDQPLLTTMYVDKHLHGVAAVQTLSRLNRTHPLKSQEDVFVLDFANEAENIQKEFTAFHETAVTPPTDPNLLYTSQNTVLQYQLLVDSEMRSFTDAYLGAQRDAKNTAQWEKAHAALYRFTDPARDRYVHLQAEDPEEADEFRQALRDYVRLYAFLAQVVPYHDNDLERLYLFGKHLLNRLPRSEDASVDIGPLDLTHLRISRTGGEHDMSLTPEGEQVLPGYSGGGSGKQSEPEKVSLADLLAQLNEHYGTNFTTHDMDADLARVVGDAHIKASALNNSEETFADVFDTQFQDKVIERAEDNTKFLRTFLDNSDLQEEYTRLARRRAYEMIHREVA